MKLEQRTNFNILFFISIATIWLLQGFLFFYSDLKYNYKNYRLLTVLSLDEKRALTTGWDFYQFLKFCDRIIPKGKDIKWEFPKGSCLGNNGYYFLKAYYYLYPRNYREDADHIIVYDREGYNIPENYKILAEYGKNKYILARH